MVMATFVVLLQILRVYLKHKIQEERDRVVGIVGAPPKLNLPAI